VYPFLEGTPHEFGPYSDARLRACVVDMLEALHAAAPGARHLAPVHEPAVAWRSELDAFLGDPSTPWSGGAYARAAHERLVPAAPLLREVVAGFDLLVRATAVQRARTVVTHGEPHPGNVMGTGEGLVLLDWDTVAVAPPERDLWFVTADGAGSSLRPPRPGAQDTLLALYRLRWYLDDLASAVHLFAGPHRRTADTERWWDGLGARVAALPAWIDALS
jgi:spectinomycin phosphotransferase